ncbi:MAG TPA: T9SS type A sorting domain-containing protein [Bacteroidales bacterium]
MKTSKNALQQHISKRAVKNNRPYFLFLKLILLSGICLCSLLISNSLFAQIPDTLWTKTYGGVQAEDGYSVQQTSDGGFIITGFTYSYGAGAIDIYLIKTNADGDTLWTKTYGTFAVDEGRSVQQTSDGGFVITGTVWAQSKGKQVWLIKTDANGDSIWAKDFGGNNDEVGHCVQQTNDGGYIITGEVVVSGNLIDLWLIKTDSDGNYDWSKIYGGTRFDKGYSVQQTTDGGYIVTGYTGSFGAGYNDAWLLKTDAAGDTLWTKTFGGFDNDYGYSVQQTTDGGYFITGVSYSFGFGSGVYLVKTDASGDILWTKNYEGGQGKSGQQTSDGGYIITGWAEPLGPANSNVWLLRTNSSGDTLWTKTFGASEYEEGRSVKQTSDGGYIVCGFTDSYGAGVYDIWLIRVEAETTNVKETTEADFELYPNPTRGKFRVSGIESGVTIKKIEIIDVFGKVVRSFTGKFIIDGMQLDLSQLPSGVYYCTLYTGEFIETKKMLIVK